MGKAFMSPKLLRILGIWIFCVDIIVGLLLIFMSFRAAPLGLGSTPFTGDQQQSANPYAPFGILIILIGVAFLVGLNMLARRMEKSKPE